MATMRTTWQRPTLVPADKARAWWFDAGPDDHKTPEHAASGLGWDTAARQVVERGKDFVTVEDRMGNRPPWRNTLRLQGKDALIVEGSGANARGQGVMRFVPDGAGSRLEMQGTFTVQGAMGLLLPILGPLVFRKQFLKDLELHVQAMERKWRERPW